MAGSDTHFNPHARGFEQDGDWMSPFSPDNEPEDDSPPLSPEAEQKALIRLRRAGRAGFIFAAWCGAEAALTNTEGYSVGFLIFSGLFMFALIATPVALMRFRRGFFSALILCALILLNLAMILLALLNGDPAYGLTSVLFNAGFLWFFVRAAQAAHTLRQG